MSRVEERAGRGTEAILWLQEFAKPHIIIYIDTILAHVRLSSFLVFAHEHVKEEISSYSPHHEGNDTG
jgi:hypothetical protein